MDEEKLNISTRKFLKKVGISSQRNIEEKVREKLKSGNTTYDENSTRYSV